MDSELANFQAYQINQYNKYSDEYAALKQSMKTDPDWHQDFAYQNQTGFLNANDIVHNMWITGGQMSHTPYNKLKNKVTQDTSKVFEYNSSSPSVSKNSRALRRRVFNDDRFVPAVDIPPGG